MASTSRHSYSIPGASLLKSRSSSKVWVQSSRPEEHSFLRRAHPRQQQPQTSYAAPNIARDRDARQPPASRAYNVPLETQASRSGPAPRPPSANEYRTQTQPQIHQSGGYAPVAHFPSSQPLASQPSSYSNSRPFPGMPQRSNTAPHPSSSRNRSEVPVTESRGVFAKMFSRVRSTSTPAQQPSPVGSGAEDTQKSSRRHKRSESAQAQPVANLVPSTSMNPPPSAPPTGKSMYDQQVSKLVTREAERDERRRRKESEKERAREERHRERDERRAKELQRAEAAALEAKQKAEQQAAAKAAKADRDRPPSRREEKQTQPRPNPVSAPPQSLSASYQAPVIQPGNTTPPIRDSTSTPAAHPSLRHPGVAIQPSNSSSQSTVSNRGYASNPVVSTTQRVNLDVPSTGPRASSSSLPPGASASDERARRDAERDRDDRRARRAERERQKEAERIAAIERDREIERLERERRELREREREKERAFRHRSQREKAYSLPANITPGVTSGSDNERTSRKESRHGRSQTQSMQIGQPYSAAAEFTRPDSRRDNSLYLPPQTDQIPQSRYDHIVYPRTSQMNQSNLSYPPPVPQKTEQPPYQRVVSDVGPNTLGHQLTTTRPPDRAHTDPLGPPQLLNGSAHTSVAMPWSDPYQQPNQPKLVTIHAAQGPPDNSPARYDQRMPERPVTEFPVSHASGQDYDAQNRQSSQDYSLFPGRSTNTSMPRAPPPMAGQPANYTSSSSSRFYSSPSQPQAMMVNSTTTGAQYNTHPRTDVYNGHTQAEKTLSPSGGPSMPSPHGLGAAPISTSMHSSSGAHQAENGYASSSMPPSAPHQVSQGGSPKGYVTSTNAVHNQGNSPKSYIASQVPPQVQLSSSVARAASNNSNNSPLQRNLPQVPGAPQGGLFPPSGTVSRTPSNNSQVAMPGYSYQQAPQPQSTQGHYSAQNPAVQATTMYSSAQNNSAASRSSYVPSNQQHVLPAHSQPQHSSPYPYSTSTVSLQNVLPHSDVRSSPSMHPQQQQQYPTQSSSSAQNVHYSSNPSAYSQGDSHLQAQSQGVSSASGYYASLSSHSLSYTPPTNAAQHPGSTATSSQQPQPSTTMYNNMTSRTESKPPQQEALYSAQKSSSPSHHANEGPSYPSDSHENSKTPRPSDYPSIQNATSASNATTPYLTASAPPTTSIKSPETTSRHITDSSMPLDRQQTPYQGEVPSTATPRPSVLQMPVTQPIAQPTPVRSQQEVAASTSTRVALPGHASNRPSSRLQEFDSPPPLTPSTSSHESHEEILMTPSSLGTTKGEPQEVSVSMQRPEKKKVGGIFGMFRSTSKAAKEPRDFVESKEHDQESRRVHTPGPSQRPEGGNKLRSTKPPPAANPLKAENVPKEPVKLTKASARHVPPPIAIPPQALAIRLVSSKSKRYRTMSAASLEALDGTANNTVVGSPTSTVRSPTPGPMTPPIRDPVEAAQEWRNKEEMVYITSGSHRRRRPGVTFDLIADDAPTPKGHRQVRTSRIYAQRGETTE